MSKDSHFHLKAALVAPTSFHFWYLLVIQFKVYLNFGFDILFIPVNYLESSFQFPAVGHFLIIFLNFFFFLLNFTVQSWNHWDWLYVKFMTNFSKRVKRTSSGIRYPGFTVSLCCFQALSNYLTFHIWFCHNKTYINITY